MKILMTRSGFWLTAVPRSMDVLVGWWDAEWQVVVNSSKSNNLGVDVFDDGFLNEAFLVKHT